MIQFGNDGLPCVDEFEAEFFLQQGIKAIGDALGAWASKGQGFSGSVSLSVREEGSWFRVRLSVREERFGLRPGEAV